MLLQRPLWVHWVAELRMLIGTSELVTISIYLSFELYSPTGVYSTFDTNLSIHKVMISIDESATRVRSGMRDTGVHEISKQPHKHHSLVRLLLLSLLRHQLALFCWLQWMSVSQWSRYRETHGLYLYRARPMTTTAATTIMIVRTQRHRQQDVHPRPRYRRPP